ncbi:hypothetical protein Tco_0089144 [Tanacetum coccineum]
MVDVPIHQEDLVVQRIPLVDTIISIVTKKITPTPPKTEAQVTKVSESDSSSTVLLRLSELEKKVEKLSKVDHAKAIKESVQENVFNEVKNQLPKLLPKVVFDFVQHRLERKVRDKSGSFQEHEKHLDLYNALIGSIDLNEATKKGKTPSKPSSTDKSVNAKETVHEDAMEADETNGNARPETSNLEWHKEPNADDAPEQNWFNELVNAEKDPLTFDDLIGSTINFTKFSKNHLKKDKITKANLEGPTFKLLKGTYRNNIELEYNLEQKQGKEVCCITEKTKAARYELKGIEYMIPKSRNAAISRHEVFSQMKILSVIRITVDKYLASSLHVQNAFEYRCTDVGSNFEKMKLSRGGQLNAAPVLEVENFTNWKKRNPEGQWTTDERKAANLDQRLKSLIMSVLPDDQINCVIKCLTAKSTWDDLLLYHEGPSNVKESRVMDLKLCYNAFKFKEGKTLRQTFTRYKALMNELVNDGIILLKLEINTGFINGLPKKWLSFCQSLRNTNHMKDSELVSLFGKLKYEEKLIDIIYETEKNKSLVSTTPLSTAFISTSIVQDFQDSPDDEEDTRSSYEYLNDLEEEY